MNTGACGRDKVPHNVPRHRQTTSLTTCHRKLSGQPQGSRSKRSAGDNSVKAWPISLLSLLRSFSLAEVLSLEMRGTSAPRREDSGTDHAAAGLKHRSADRHGDERDNQTPHHHHDRPKLLRQRCVQSQDIRRGMALAYMARYGGAVTVVPRIALRVRTQIVPDSFSVPGII